MPKAEQGSVKDLSKRIKAKGLMKLKFYCQQCQKQCRDANGFKCHLTSDSHLRQMKLFSERAGIYLDQYSREFEKSFLDTLRMRHTTSTVRANTVYQEVIQDRDHIHMNSTMWASLTDFVKYLGKMGKCKVDEQEPGMWYISYINRDEHLLARQEAFQQRQEQEAKAEDAMQERMEKQRVEAAKALDRIGVETNATATELETNERGEPRIASVQVSLKGLATKAGAGSKVVTVTARGKSVFGSDDEDDDDDPAVVGNQDDQLLSASSGLQSHSHEWSTRQRVAPSTTNNQQGDLLKQEKGNAAHAKRNHVSDSDAVATAKKQRTHDDRSDVDPDDHIVDDEEPGWLYRDIIVRVVNKSLADGQYFRRKAVVERVVGEKDVEGFGYTAQVIVLKEDLHDDSFSERDEGDVLQLDQEDLETVVPKRTGQKVRILKGRHRGKKAIAVDFNKGKYQAVLELSDGTRIRKVDYDDFSRVSTS